MTNEIYPCIWFNGQASAAADFYCTVFKDSRITTDNGMVVIFELGGEKMMGLNGGPKFKINPAISFFVVCETEEEIDKAWQKFNEGGSVLMQLDKYPWSEKYGWVQDKFGVNWQLSFGKIKEVGQKFSPTIMFTGEQHGRAEEAVHFYTSVFDNAAVSGILKYTAEDNDTEGTVKHAMFNLGKYVFMAMDSSQAHQFKINEAISFVVNCNTQAEIDYYWNKLTEDGEESMCGWLKDKFGVSWQIVPEVLGELMADAEKGPRVIQAFMQMKKFDIEKLMNA